MTGISVAVLHGERGGGTLVCRRPSQARPVASHRGHPRQVAAVLALGGGAFSEQRAVSVKSANVHSQEPGARPGGPDRLPTPRTAARARRFQDRAEEALALLVHEQQIRAVWVRGLDRVVKSRPFRCMQSSRTGDPDHGGGHRLGESEQEAAKTPPATSSP